MAERVGIEVFAKMAGYSVEYARQIMRSGKGPRFMRIGRRYYFFVSDIEEWLMGHMVESKQK